MQKLFGEAGVQLPGDWIDRSIYTFVADEKSAPPANVVITRDHANDLQKFADAQIRGFNDLKISEDSASHVSGLPARLRVFTFTAPPKNVRVQQMQAFVQRGVWIYTFTFSCLPEAFAEKRQVFQTILETFTFTSR